MTPSVFPVCGFLGFCVFGRVYSSAREVKESLLIVSLIERLLRKPHIRVAYTNFIHVCFSREKDCRIILVDGNCSCVLCSYYCRTRESFIYPVPTTNKFGMLRVLVCIELPLEVREPHRSGAGKLILAAGGQQFVHIEWEGRIGLPILTEAILGRPLGYLVISLMVLIRDPIY